MKMENNAQSHIELREIGGRWIANGKCGKAVAVLSNVKIS
jgi:hypothetical protein